jgi:hypothetical protein
MYTFEDNKGFTPLDLARTYKRTEALQFGIFFKCTRTVVLDAMKKEEKKEEGRRTKNPGNEQDQIDQ